MFGFLRGIMKNENVIIIQNKDGTIEHVLFQTFSEAAIKVLMKASSSVKKIPNGYSVVIKDNGVFTMFHPDGNYRVMGGSIITVAFS